MQILPILSRRRFAFIQFKSKTLVMKRLFLMVLLCTIPNFLNGQYDTLRTHLNHHTFFDRFGQKFRPETIRIPIDENFVPDPCSNFNEIFNLYFTDSDGGIIDASTQFPQIRDIICRVFNDLAVSIEPNYSPITCQQNKVNFRVRFLNLDQSIGAYATSFYETPHPYDDDYVTTLRMIRGMVWEQINTGVTPVELYNGTPDFEMYHGELVINASLSNLYYTGIDPTQIGTSTDIDLYHLTLHEIFHALGMASALTLGDFFSGANAVASIYNQPSVGIGNYVTLWDTFLGNGNGEFVSENGCMHYNIDAIDTDVSSNTSPGNLCTNLTASYLDDVGVVQNINIQEIYTPDTWQTGGSLSHLGCGGGVNPGYLMYSSLTYPNGVPMRAPSQTEMNILCALGYTINSTYGLPIDFEGDSFMFSTETTFQSCSNDNIALAGDDYWSDDICINPISYTRLW